MFGSAGLPGDSGRGGPGIIPVDVRTPRPGPVLPVYNRLAGGARGACVESAVSAGGPGPISDAGRRSWYVDHAGLVVVGARLDWVSVASSLMIDGRAIDSARLADICRRFGGVELAVFGSTARGDVRRDSDVDLLYVLAPDARLGFAIDQLEDELADLFGRNVDLV
jgi:predicted nucleotidyltransferase